MMIMLEKMAYVALAGILVAGTVGVLAAIIAIISERDVAYKIAISSILLAFLFLLWAVFLGAIVMTGGV